MTLIPAGIPALTMMAMRRTQIKMVQKRARLTWLRLTGLTLSLTFSRLRLLLMDL